MGYRRTQVDPALSDSQWALSSVHYRFAAESPLTSYPHTIDGVFRGYQVCDSLKGDGFLGNGGVVVIQKKWIARQVNYLNCVVCLKSSSYT
jgi:hypothetical protein